MPDHPLFVYGTLRDPDVLAFALSGLETQLCPRPAQLNGFRAVCSPDGPFPVLLAGDGTVAGLLLEPMTRPIREALVRFEGDFAYDLKTTMVDTETGPASAMVFMPHKVDTPAIQREWRLDEWTRTGKPLFVEMLADLALPGPDGMSRPVLDAGVRRRALARLAARRDPPPVQLGSGHRQLDILSRTRHYLGFFALDKIEMRHDLFEGGTSSNLTREIFVTGDAVSVLPWDPVQDTVLLIEQIRAGMVARGDPLPWNVEVIAGLIDQDESAEDTARREAHEEAGIHLGRMELLGRYHTSPGALTEHITAFVGEADLGEYDDGVYGLGSEHEDIRTMVIPVDEALATLDTGEARNAPMMISLLAFARRRDQLRALWSR